MLTAGLDVVEDAWDAGSSTTGARIAVTDMRIPS
jgi:hypothetical protein